MEELTQIQDAKEFGVKVGCSADTPSYVLSGASMNVAFREKD